MHTDLAFVNMVVRMHRLFTPEFTSQDLNGSVADDFIDIHVGLSSRSSLPHH